MREAFDLLGAPWTYLVVGLLVYGFFPRLALRLIVLAFHSRVRRREVLADLDAVDYLKRPLFVFEQLEVALVEGLGERVRFLWLSRWVERWSLRSGVPIHREHPDTFDLPSINFRYNARPGDLVKLMFVTRSGWSERMWVRVTKRTRKGYEGSLDNKPLGIPGLRLHQKVRFTGYHIIDLVPFESAATKLDQVDDEAEQES